MMAPFARPLAALAVLALAALGACVPATAASVVTPFVAPTLTPGPSPSAHPALAAQAPATPPTAAPSPEPPGPPATPTPAGVVYTVVAGDTFWDIALAFNLSPEQLLDANPTVDADRLYPGDRLFIPDPGQLPPTSAAPAARVRLDGGGLRLRVAPSLTAEAVATLTALTPLEVTGRTLDSAWLQVVAPSGAAGWAPSHWLTIGIALDPLPVISQSTAQPAELGAAPTAGPATLTGPTARAFEILRHGLALGNRPNVFSKVGDSITVSPVFLAPIGRGAYDLQAYGHLQPAIDFFAAVPARGGLNSFANPSLAAKVGWRARAVLSPTAADPALCGPGEPPLLCEYRQVRPALALIMLGTNDVPYTPPAEFDADLRRIFDATLERGILPVVSTIPPLHRAGLEGRAEALNAVIVALAGEYELPLVDYYAALLALPNSGLAGDGVHPSWAPAGHSADFTPEYLQYGMVARNLVTLQALDNLYRQVLQP
ncbi:MAG: LysM peptidoglycan-binding domain-containing protein [Anaerolineales bacterium]|nr:LysM peptidoglycan-binding domain-containing protein [Anaerolineales bacterium]